MQKVSLTLGAADISTARELAQRYGRSSSLSSIVRRAISLLNDRWASLDNAEPGAAEVERLAMVEFLSEARRGNATLR